MTALPLRARVPPGAAYGYDFERPGSLHLSNTNLGTTQEAGRAEAPTRNSIGFAAGASSPQKIAGRTSKKVRMRKA